MQRRVFARSRQGSQQRALRACGGHHDVGDRHQRFLFVRNRFAVTLHRQAKQHDRHALECLDRPFLLLESSFAMALSQ